jgi:uncharacterized protein (DUF2384 family)
MVGKALRCLGRREATLTELALLDRNVASAAVRAFDAPASAAEWLISPAFALNGDVPLAVLRQPDGQEAVLQALYRIEFNILG